MSRSIKTEVTHPYKPEMKSMPSLNRCRQVRSGSWLVVIAATCIWTCFGPLERLAYMRQSCGCDPVTSVVGATDSGARRECIHLDHSVRGSRTTTKRPSSSCLLFGPDTQESIQSPESSLLMTFKYSCTGTAVQGSAVARCRALHPRAGRSGPYDRGR